MRLIIRTLLFSMALLSSIGAKSQEQVTRGSVEETGGNIKVLLETASWGQNHPFNNQCWTKYGGTTHAKTGCVATAYAIVLRYHEYPTEGTSRTLYNCQAPTYVEITDRVYDWENMPLVYDGNWSETQIYEVSKIMSHLAHALFSSFGANATATNEERETEKLNRYFNYPKIAASYQMDHTQEEWEAKIRESLDNGCPIPYAANNSGTGDSRHMFVIDGYTDNGYYHFNFGWNGSGNGWFKLNDITPYQGDDYSWKSNSEHYANFNLKPEREEFLVTVTVNDSEAGTATVNGGESATIPEGLRAKLIATPNEGYIFTGWTLDGGHVSDSASYSPRVTAPAGYTANFEKGDTGIEEITEKKSGAIYDLRGNRIEKITRKGLYIIDNRLEFVR